MNQGKRVNYELIRNKYRANGKGNVRLTQSSLFLTKDIDATKSNYSFDVLENQTQTIAPDEIRLNINDEFILTHLGVYLYGTWDVGQQKQGFQLLSYSPVELSDDALKTKNLYAGQLKIAVNNIVYLEKWDTRKHEKVTRTQFANQLAGTNNATMPSNDFYDDSMIALSPMITLSGSKKNAIEIQLPFAISPANLTWTNGAGTNVAVNITRIAVRMYGLNAQNGAKFQS